MPTLKYVGNADRYRVTNSDVDVPQGETVTVDEEMAGYLLKNGEFETVERGDEDAEVKRAAPILAADATVDEIEAAIADVESPDAIRYVLEDERDGPARTTAIEALETRLSQLED